MTSIQRTAIALVVLLLVIFGIYKWGYGRGWSDRDQEMQAQIAVKNEEARAQEQTMAKVIQTKEQDLRKANDVIDKKQSDLDHAIRSGRVRFPTASCAQASKDSAPPIGDRNETRSEPDGTADQDPDARASQAERETLALIAQIAADGDRAINQLNACITAYEEIRITINADSR